MSLRHHRRTVLRARPASGASLTLLIALAITLGLSRGSLADPSGFATSAPAPRARTTAPTLQPNSPPAPLIAGRSAVIYPPQQLNLRFSHRKHLAQAMTCLDCHAAATTSADVRDTLTPPMTTCLRCHTLDGQGDAPGTCKTCHPAYDHLEPLFPKGHILTPETAQQVLNPPPVPIEIPAASLKFSHRTHADAGVSCVACHADVAQVDLATHAQLPTMRSCLDCHTGAADAPPRTCGTCHLTDAGMILTDLPSGQLMPRGQLMGDDHRLDFQLRHGPIAQQHNTYCSNCHDQAYCLDCHNGVAKPFATHPPNYQYTHAIEAQADTLRCTTCHNLQTFCVSCHAQTGSHLESNSRPSSLRLHPQGFVGDVGSANFHGPIAAQNMMACASCHQEQTCLRCHQAVNPHGGDFLARCGAMRRRNAHVCTNCHKDGDPVLMLCQ